MKYQTPILLFLIFGFMGVSLAATAPVAEPNQNNSAAAPPPNAEFTDANRPIGVEKPTPTFTIKLPSNITTGYSWFLQAPIASFITPVSHVYRMPSKPMPGAGGSEEWVFKVEPQGFVVPQTTNITLVYSRPWEMKEAKQIQFKVFTR